MIHRITLYGEPILRQPTQPITTFDAALRRLSEDMVETMYASEGIGLAAPQIGLNTAICVIDVAPLAEPGSHIRMDGKSLPLDLVMPLVLINPAISDRGGERGPYREGCLSIPDIHLDVVRPLSVSVRFQDLEGAEHRIEATGIISRCLQHEIDHLNGVLFLDRVEPDQLSGVRSRLKKLQRSSRERSKEIP